MQNCRAWLAENPHYYIDMDLHPEKVGVWYADSRKLTVGLIFFQGTVQSDIYCSIISQIISLLEPDGAKLHTSEATTEFLKFFLDDQLISTGLQPLAM